MATVTETAKSSAPIAEIENIGPIRHLTFPCPKDGGLVVFKGRNGAGKSTALNAVDRVLGKDVKLQKNEKCPGSGHVETPLGVSLKVSQTVRRTEEQRDDEGKDVGLTVEVLDDEFSITDLVDPKEKDQAAADRRRIKALLRTANAQADITLFEQLFRNDAEFKAIIREETRKTDDLVQMASRVKEDIEKKARDVEAEVDKAENDILRLEGALVGFEPNAELNLEQIRRDHEQAVERLGALKRDRAAYLNASELIGGLVEREAAAKESGAVDLAKLEAEAKVESDFIGVKTALREQKEREIARLNAEITETNLQIEAAVARKETANARVESARASSALLESIQKQLADARAVPVVTDEDVKAAAEKASWFATSIANAERQADLQRKADDINAKRLEKKNLERKAKDLRDAAKATDGVLTDVIKTLGTPIKIGYDDKGNPRLEVFHEARDRDVYFSELSKGEKLKLVADVAVKAVGKGGMFTIPQELFEGLDEDNRIELAQTLRGTGVIAVTAQCSSGPLRAELV